MTSRVLFYKAMVDDLRHRIWMIALSCLASFMAMPVAYLLVQQDWEKSVLRWMTNNTYPTADILGRKAELVRDFFVEYMSLTGGMVLFVGALIVGIFGFRYVFSKKMIDLYHSVPIKRSQLFFVHYTNGFLIWFVPMLIGALSCAVLSLFFLGDIAAWIGVLGELFVTIINLVLAFLLIYHLAIVSVMLCGNILNTLVCGAIISGAVLAVYGMAEVFCAQYFSTYYSFFEKNILDLLWTSPAAGSIYQLVMRCDVWNVSAVVMNVIMAIALLAAGFLLYLRRPSELAEQGMKIKPVQIVFKTVVSVLAGMVGWLLFGLLTGMEKLGWTIFGAVFASILVYGILDIIFNMDFKAFYKNKIQMGLTTLATILIGCAFMFDWVGFDAYVPQKNNIASIGFVVSGISYGGYYDDAYDGLLSTETRMEAMEYTNKENAYALLKRMAERASGKEVLDSPYEERTGWCYVHVTEVNGRSYYRSYRVRAMDEDVLVPILTDESYVKTNLQIPQFIIDDITFSTDAEREYDYTFRIENKTLEESVFHEEHAKAILEAYNRDLAENPRLYIYQDDEVLLRLVLRNQGDNYFNFYLDVYESMNHTIEALKRCGYDNMLDNFHNLEVEQIRVTAYMYNNMDTLEEIFGLTSVEASEQKEPEPAVVKQDGEIYYGYAERAEVTADVVIESEQTYVAKFYDKKDIDLLLEKMSLMTPHQSSLFAEDYVNCDIRIFYRDSYGEQSTHASLKAGAMPEELLNQFEMISQKYY